MAIDYERMYSPRLTVPDYAAIFARWESESAAARRTARCYLDVPYGSQATEKMDIFPAEGRSRGLMMFIHGGYWRALDKRDHSFVAPAFARAGITVAVPNYALCPAVRVEDIVRQMLQATAWLWRNGTNFGAPLHRVHVAGHSAGGHLTAMMMAALWPAFAPDLPAGMLAGGVSISGVYDVAPLMNVSINADVRLDEAQARKVSPALMPPATGAPLLTAVGAEENEGFQVQHALIGKRWAKVNRERISVPGANHFTILDRLADPGGDLHQAVLRFVGG